MQQSFQTWWATYKLPDLGKLQDQHFEALRRIAMLAYKAGQRHERTARALRSK